MNRLLFGDNLRGSPFNYNALFKESSGQAQFRAFTDMWEWTSKRALQH
jgi:hypothetical protein